MQGFLLFGSPGRARTADLMINSHPLYRLSYRGIICFSMARPERFELPTARFVAVYSIQLSYGRLTETLIMRFQHFPVNCKFNQFTNIWMNQRWGY
jgi:hypothetical protein